MRALAALASLLGVNPTLGPFPEFPIPLVEERTKVRSHLVHGLQSLRRALFRHSRRRGFERLLERRRRRVRVGRRFLGIRATRTRVPGVDAGGGSRSASSTTATGSTPSRVVSARTLPTL